MHPLSARRGPRRRGASRLLAVGLGLGLALGLAPAASAQKRPASTATATAPKGGSDEQAIARYFAELERAGLLDVETGTKELLTRELAGAEKLLREGATINAAVALYAIVESPRFTDLDDFVEYQNAEYYLAVALANAGAYDSALSYLLRVLSRGPSALYWAPAHRRAVDIALETRRFTEVLADVEGVQMNEPIPPGASGERAYLKARIAYEKGDFATAEGQLAQISRKSRLYSSALYLRGVIRTRRGEFRDAAQALCEIVDTPDDNKYTFVVDDRYFTIKDIARIGLGRIAHEVGEYDDAYYHYFQIPDDSDHLPDALFEAAWSMYQKRELATARDLVKEFEDSFSTSPLAPEASLLAGYVELADCEFVTSQTHYDKLITRLGPVVAEMDRIRKDPDRRSALFDRAIARWREERANPQQRMSWTTSSSTDRVLALLRLDPQFVRLHEAVSGLRQAAGDAPHVVRAWRSLSGQLGATKVRAIARDRSFEEEEKETAGSLVEDVARLREQIDTARADLRAGVRAGTLPRDVAAQEEKRLGDLEGKVKALEGRTRQAAASADAAVSDKAAPGLGPLVAADLARASELERASAALIEKLEGASDKLAQQAIERLYGDTRRVLDKAKLGKVDAVIGQKRKLEIEVQDLASGRFPAELHGRLWEEGLIGDDEEYWPFEGEYWADEYEGWR